MLTGMSDRYGSVLGSEQVTFYGTRFSDTATTTVTIDNRACAVDSTSTTAIVCTTMDKPYVADTPNLYTNSFHQIFKPKLDIYIEGMGLVATKGQVYRYVSRWSDP